METDFWVFEGSLNRGNDFQVCKSIDVYVYELAIPSRGALVSNTIYITAGNLQFYGKEPIFHDSCIKE